MNYENFEVSKDSETNRIISLLNLEWSKSIYPCLVRAVGKVLLMKFS